MKNVDSPPSVRPDYGLTPREMKVLVLAAQGLSRPQIGERLGLRFYTVGSHLKNIHRKLGVHNRAGAVSVAWRQGLLKDSSKLAPLAIGVGFGLRFCSCCGTAFEAESVPPKDAAVAVGKLVPHEVNASVAPHS